MTCIFFIFVLIDHLTQLVELLRVDVYNLIASVTFIQYLYP